MGLEVIALGVLTVGSTAVGIKQQRDATKESEKANAAQKRIQDIKATRERRKQVRDAQTAQAEIAIGAQASGTTGSSGVAVGQGSVQSQLASNLSFLDQTQELTDKTSMFNQSAANKRTKASTAQAVGGLALQGASLFATAPEAS